MLVPPQITSGANIPQGTDYVCLKGGRPYRWLGDPPRLVTKSSVARNEPNDDD